MKIFIEHDAFNVNFDKSVIKKAECKDNFDL